jgi:hypothetical protein
MTSLAVGTALVALLALGGWWPMRRLAGPLVGSSRTGRLALATALGAAITGLVQLVVVIVVGWPATVGVPVVLAALSTLAALRDRSHDAAPGDASRAARDTTDPAAAPGGGPANGAACDDVPPPGGDEASSERLRFLLARLLLLVAVVGSAAAVGLPFRSDGSKFWAPKARELAEVSAREAPTLHDPLRLGFHRDYPLLVPVLLAPAFGLGPPDGAAGPKLVLHALQLALLVLAASLLARRGDEGVLFAIVFVSMPLLTATVVRESSVSGGFVDGVLALWLLLLVHAADRLRRGVGGAGDRVLAALTGAALVGTKLEGLVALGIVALAWLLAGPRRRDAWIVVAAALLVSVPTLWLRTQVAGDAPIVDPSLWLDGANLRARLLPLVLGLGGTLLDVTSFGLLPLLLLLRIRGLDRFGVWVVLGVAAFLLLVYGATTMHLGRHLYTSLHRLTFQWLPAVTLLVAAGRARSAVGEGRGEPRGL